MIFTRNDGTDPLTVTYLLVDCPGYNFSVVSSRAGVVITGTTPAFTDWIPIQQVLTWAQYQAQAIKERGRSIPQHKIDSGEIW